MQTREVAQLLSYIDSERRYYQEIATLAPARLAVIASDGRLSFVNTALCSFLGVSLEVADSLRLADLLASPEEAQRVLDTMTTGLPEGGLVSQVRTATGPRRCLLRVRPLRGWAETFEALLALEDIAAGDETAAIAVESLHRQLDGPDAILWERHPATLECVYVNAMASGMIGTPPEQWLGTTAPAGGAIHPDDADRVRSAYRSAARGSRRSCEYRAFGPHGRIIWLCDFVRPRWDESGSVEALHGVTVEITARRFHDWLLRQSERMAALERNAGMVAQQCGDIAMKLASQARDLLENLPSKHPGVAQAHAIMDLGGRLVDLSEKHLSFARQLVLQPRELDLNELIRQLRPKLIAELGNQVEFSVRLEPRLGHIRADSARLGEIILTLVRQANNAMPEGGKLLLETGFCTIENRGPEVPGASPSGRYAALSVMDTGVEMDESTRNRIFEPYYTGPRATPGLPALYSVMRQMAGDVFVARGVEGGAAITILLPFLEEPLSTFEQPRGEASIQAEPSAPSKPAAPGEVHAEETPSESGTDAESNGVDEPASLPTDEAPVPSQAASETAPASGQAEPEEEPPIPAAAPQAAPTATILHADQDLKIRVLVRKVLSGRGYQVIDARAGMEALQSVADHAGPLDLLLVEDTLPGMTGLELASCLKEAYPDLKVILVQSDGGELPPAEPDWFVLRKPYTLPQLLATVRTVLGR